MGQQILCHDSLLHAGAHGHADAHYHVDAHDHADIRDDPRIIRGPSGTLLDSLRGFKIMFQI